MPMKSADLYRELRAGLGGWFRAERFKRARAQLGWSRPPLLIWFQCDQWGWDPYAGSGFFVNFQIGGGVSPWSGPTERLQHFLTDAELEAARELQNGVIRRLSPPPPHHVQALRSAFAKSSSDPEALVEALMAAFQPVTTPYRRHQDFALRYFAKEDVQKWSSFLLSVLPRIVITLASEASGPTGAGMDKEREASGSLPIACTLTAAELAALRGGLLPGLLTRASEREVVAGGFRWRFSPRADLVKEIGAVIEAEHRCCRFLRFHLVVEPGDGAVWLEVTGPEGTDEFLRTLTEAT
jgi:hypothetical protein